MNHNVLFKICIVTALTLIYVVLSLAVHCNMDCILATVLYSAAACICFVLKDKREQRDKKRMEEARKDMHIYLQF